MEEVDYTNILNSINNHLSTISNILESGNVEKSLNLLVCLFLVLLFLYIMRGE